MRRPSWLFWVVVVLAILWNGFGAYDGYMTLTQNDDYLKDYPPDLVAYWEAMPEWRYALWALGVGTALIASTLMIFRSALAAPLFVIGPICMVVGWADDAVRGGLPLYGAVGMIGSLVIFGISVAFAWYAYRQKRRGVLR